MQRQISRGLPIRETGSRTHLRANEAAFRRGLGIARISNPNAPPRIASKSHIWREANNTARFLIAISVRACFSLVCKIKCFLTVWKTLTLWCYLHIKNCILKILTATIASDLIFFLIFTWQITWRRASGPCTRYVAENRSRRFATWARNSHAWSQGHVNPIGQECQVVASRTTSCPSILSMGYTGVPRLLFWLRPHASWISRGNCDFVPFGVASLSFSLPLRSGDWRLEVIVLWRRRYRE